MNSSTIDSAVLKAHELWYTTQPSQSQKSIAKWFTVDGKLVCKWFPAEN